jgi:hypothetical protein
MAFTGKDSSPSYHPRPALPLVQWKEIQKLCKKEVRVSKAKLVVRGNPDQLDQPFVLPPSPKLTPEEKRAGRLGSPFSMRK